MKVHHQKGAVAVEFALILPVLVLMFFGIVEFSLLLFNKQVITNASREGARAGIVAGGSPRVSDESGYATINNVVSNYCTNNLITFGTDSGPQTTVISSGSSFGDNLTVTVTYQYGFLVLSNFGFDPVTLTARTVMKLE